MKVLPDKLAEDLGRRIAPIYVVSGDEPLLVQESCDLIRASLRKAGYTERDLFHVEGDNFDWGQVLFSAASMSLFAERKILELRMPSGKPGNDGAAALAGYAEHSPSDTVMLLVLPRVDARTQKLKWFKALESAAVFVQVWPKDIKEMPRWINDRLKRAGLTASREAVNALVDRTEGNLLAAIQEIQRLKLLSERGTVEISDIVDGVADSSRYDVFELIDAAVNQEYQRALKIIRVLELEGTAILYINTMLAAELRSLASMASLIEQGRSVGDAVASARVFYKRKTLVTNYLRQHRLAQILPLQTQISRIDKMAKGIGTGDPWILLTDVVLSLAGKPVIEMMPTS